ncbi:cysteine hydrolase family protein [Kitasatospora sp. NPDC101183]|uniref:cysteine hydrolase family protein n=1 Tax=Kitasatospora sp. NPDC101183 TaxID=3364100 RepID=UPI0037FA2C89
MTLVPAHTALLVLDVQPAVLAAVPEAVALLDRIARAVTEVRDAGGLIAYARVGFTEAGWAAVPAANRLFAAIAEHRALHHEDPSTAVHERVAPRAGDLVVRKIRTGALSTTDLDHQLRERGITTLVVCGLTTGGAVLSTVLDAADRDYRLLVLADAVADPDRQAHDLLLSRVLPTRAEVVTTPELRALLA